MVPTPWHPRVFALGYSEAGMLLRGGSPEIRAIIAIFGQREFPVDSPQIPRKLVLEFDDSESPDCSDPVEAAKIRFRQRRAAEDGLILRPPTPEDAEAIVQFARDIEGLEGTLLCTCQGGISRSPAAARICLATWTGPGLERYCMDYVREIRRGAVPHPDLVRFADRILDLMGALVAASEEHE